MKKYTIVFLLISGIVYFACESDSITVSEDPNTDITDTPDEPVESRATNPHDSLGIYHNIYLDSIYQKVNRAYQNGELENLTEQEMLDELTDAAQELIADFYSGTDYDEIEEIVLRAIDEVDNASTNYFKLEMDSLNYSTTFNDLIDDFEDIFIDSSHIDTVLADIQDLVDIAVTWENETEKAGALRMLAVAKHSANYWNLNMGNWETLIDNSTSLKKPSDYLEYKWYRGGWGGYSYDCPDCREIIKQDAVWGTVGALLGIGTGPGAVVGGAYGASAASMSQALLNLMD